MQIRKPSIALSSSQGKLVGDIGGHRGLASHPSHAEPDSLHEDPVLTPDDLLLNLPPGILEDLDDGLVGSVGTPDPFALRHGRRRSQIADEVAAMRSSHSGHL